MARDGRDRDAACNGGPGKVARVAGAIGLIKKQKTSEPKRVEQLISDEHERGFATELPSYIGVQSLFDRLNVINCITYASCRDVRWR